MYTTWQMLCQQFNVLLPLHKFSLNCSNKFLKPATVAYSGPNQEYQQLSLQLHVVAKSVESLGSQKSVPRVGKGQLPSNATKIRLKSPEKYHWKPPRALHLLNACFIPE
jgi:hypothetical protein